MGKNKFHIVGIRSGMIGDTIMSLPLLRYLYKDHKRFGIDDRSDIRVTWVIGDRFKQSSSIYLGNPYISDTYITKYHPEQLLRGDLEQIGNLHPDMLFDVTPQHPDPDQTIWMSKYTCVEETIRMAFGDWAKLGGINSPNALLDAVRSAFKNDPDGLKPRLFRWWGDKSKILFGELSNRPKIAVWPCANYGKWLSRSPSQGWYEELFDLIIKNCDVDICIFGHLDDYKFNLNNRDRIFFFRQSTFFNQVKMTLECDVMLGTDSGSSWVMGAYGHPQINLLTNHYPHHTDGFWPLSPPNVNNLNVDFCALGGCDNISIPAVAESLISKTTNREV